jgi:hypothetical protein
MAPRTEVMEMVTDVLVLGGGPAATWAGVAAAESGASRDCRSSSSAAAIPMISSAFLITWGQSARTGGLRSSGRPLRSLAKSKAKSPRRRLRVAITALTRASRSAATRAMRHPKPRLMRPLRSRRHRLVWLFAGRLYRARSDRRQSRLGHPLMPAIVGSPDLRADPQKRVSSGTSRT